MGSCLCKEKAQVGGERSSCPASATTTTAEMSEPKRPKIMEPDIIEELILKILHYTSTCQESGGFEPLPLLQISALADTEEGWCNVVLGLMNTIPMNDPLGPSAIVIILDFCPLPARDTILGFTQSLHLSPERVARAYLSRESVRIERNLLFILGCIADKFGSHSSVPMLTKEMLNYLITFLVDEECSVLILAALVTLEKLAGSAQNKAEIDKALRRHFLYPLLPLEIQGGSRNYPRRRVAFVARWALDNIFIYPGRKFSFETVKMDDINVVLNMRDMSNYLKISPNGLEARCDSLSFESVRATLEMKTGVWYYEVELITAGVMQIGFATKNTKFESHEGYGVGDDEHSVAYDGCRRLVWHKAQATRVEQQQQPWRAGDVLGCLADTTRGEVVFSLNGFQMPPFTPDFLANGEGFYAAASFMVNQQCVFNFGACPFLFPPVDRLYNIMNTFGTLTSDQKLVIPRCVEMDMILANEVPTHTRCAVCLVVEGSFGLEPCQHSSFCPHCVSLLTECPLCRTPVNNIFMLAP